MKTHELKCILEPFQQKWNGNKNWEYRKNDRDFKVGDILIEKEYDSVADSYSGREIVEKVTWVLPGGLFGVPIEYCIMSTEIIKFVPLTDEAIFKHYGWEVECQSPFEIKHEDGSSASGQAAWLIKNFLEEEFIKEKNEKIY